MELLQLTYFCSAAETENFSKTAKLYMVPASNISQSIHRLEDELGTVLFDRNINKLTLNEQGKLFYNYIKPALTLIHDGKKKLSPNDDISGKIKILAETNRRTVTKAIEIFQENYKDVSFFINHSPDGNPENYDFIISDKVYPQKYFKKYPLLVDEILLALPKEHPFSAKEEISVKELENERFITMGANSRLYKLTHEICSKAGFEPNIVIQSEDPFYNRKYVEMGLGISFVPSYSWEGMFSDGVVFKHIASEKRYTSVFLNTQKYISKASELFLETLCNIADNKNLY